MTDWEENLFSLNETSFLSLIKNYVLSVSTPFNKQEMIRKLSLWLGNRKNAGAIVSRLSDEERKILSVIYYLKNVPAEKLPLDWSDETRENLTERLLIFKSSGCYRIAPPLEPFLREKGILDFLLLLDVRDKNAEYPLFIPDDRLLMGFLSFFSEEKAFFLNDGSPRRRIIEELQERLPYPDHREDSFFCELAELFLSAGLLEKRGNSLILGPMEELERFEQHSPADRIHYLAVLNGPSDSRGKLRFLLSRLITLLPEGKVMSKEGWLRLLYFISPHPSRQDLHRWEELPSRLSLLGLCTFNGEELGFPTMESLSEEDGERPILVQPNGDIDVAPGTPFTASLVLSAFLDKGETFYRFRLTRESFESGLRRGRNSKSLSEDLESLSGHPLPGNLIMNLQEWEKQLYSLRKAPGVLLRVTGYPRRIMNQIPNLDEHILEKIGDEWILMREDTADKWEALLKEVGLDPFEEHKLGPSSREEEFPDSEQVQLPENGKGADDIRSDRTGETEDLKKYLSSLKLPEEQEKEFIRRIERGVILLPEQISPSALRTEICKAGGLDFNSKLRQVSAAMETEHAQLELKLPGKGTIRTVRALPLELNNSREESLLLFRNEETGEEESIAVRKILEVIRFHGSLLS